VLSNSHKYFCVNYFVDEAYPTIEEQNIFTATELSTLLPFYGANEYQYLLQRNGWVMKYFPNFRPRSVDQVSFSSSTGKKKLLESLINICAPRVINQFLRKLSLNRWKRIYEDHYSKEDFNLVFKSSQYASKNHPRNFQKKVLSLFEEKVKLFEEKQVKVEPTNTEQPRI
jgi:hypothetical protein